MLITITNSLAPFALDAVLVYLKRFSFTFYTLRYILAISIPHLKSWVNLNLCKYETNIHINIKCGKLHLTA